MSMPPADQPRSARRKRIKLAGGAGVVLIVAAVIATVMVSGSTASPTTLAAAKKCPSKDGWIRVFSTNDNGGVGGGLGPSEAKAAALENQLINASGGIAGCKFSLTVVDEPLTSWQSGLQKYRSAIASGKYNAFFLMFDSALMRALPRFTNAANKPLIAAGVGDHLPFFNTFQKYNFQAAVTTLGEARAVAQFVKAKNWKRVAIITPNYAYGQDFASAFEDYFKRIVPDGKIVSKQLPAFGEKNMLPYVNAVVAAKPDVVLGGEYGPDTLSLWKVWKTQKLKIPTIWYSENSALATITTSNPLPPNAYGYDRCFPDICKKTPRGAAFYNAFVKKYGRKNVNALDFAVDSATQLLKALVEKTGSLNPDAWVDAVSHGFSYVSPYRNGLTKVNSINHMVYSCPTVGKLVYRPGLGGTYDPADTKSICLEKVITDAEIKKLTHK